MHSYQCERNTQSNTVPRRVAGQVALVAHSCTRTDCSHSCCEGFKNASPWPLGMLTDVHERTWVGLQVQLGGRHEGVEHSWQAVRGRAGIQTAPASDKDTTGTESESKPAARAVSSMNRAENGGLASPHVHAATQAVTQASVIIAQASTREAGANEQLSEFPGASL